MPRLAGPMPLQGRAAPAETGVVEVEARQRAMRRQPVLMPNLPPELVERRELAVAAVRMARGVVTAELRLPMPRLQLMPWMEIRPRTMLLRLAFRALVAAV